MYPLQTLRNVTLNLFARVRISVVSLSFFFKNAFWIEFRSTKFRFDSIFQNFDSIRFDFSKFRFDFFLVSSLRCISLEWFQVIKKEQSAAKRNWKTVRMFIPYSLTLLPDGWILEQYESLPHTVRATEVGHFWRGSLETDESNQSMFGEFLKRMMNMHVLNVQIKCQCLLRISYVFSIYKNVFTKMLFTFVYIDFRDIQLFFFREGCSQVSCLFSEIEQGFSQQCRK